LTGTTEKQSQRTDWAICIILFLSLSSLYFATASGITCSNDGSHYALTRALAENGSFEISPYASYAEGNDLARRDDRTFSDRPPGTALVASLFYTAGGLLPPPLVPLQSRHDAENPRLLYAMLVSVWAGTGTVVLLYRTLRELHVSVSGALTTSLVFALGTAHWKYSTVLFSHALSSLTVMLAIYLAIRAARSSSIPWVLPLALGFVAAYSVLVEYSNAVMVLAIALYLLFNVASSTPSRLPFYASLLLLGGLIPASFLAYYNHVNFGAPLTFSYAYAIKYPWASSFSSTFSFPLGQGLRAMLVWGQGGGWCDPTCYNQGLFLLSPILLLSLPGLVPYCRRSRRPCMLTTGLFLIYLVLFSTHRTFHGFTTDGRYLVPFLALWCIPLAFFFDRILVRTKRPAWQAVAYLAFYGLFFLSLRNLFLHIGFSYNYHLDLSQLSPIIAHPANWSYLSAHVLPNTGNLPLLWLLEGGISLLCLLFSVQFRK
jgi:hypothetical protein